MSCRCLTAGAALALTLLTIAPAEAQETARPDFSGTWVLSIGDSDFGMSPAPDSAIMQIERADDHIILTRTSYHPAAGGASATTFDMPADGETHRASTPDGETDASVEWNGAALDVWIVAQSNVGDVDVSETWTIGEDSSQLLIDRLIEVPGMGEFEQSLVFDRRE